MKPRNRGFTLIESLLVVIILAIIISLSLPILRKTFYDIQLNAACQNLISLSNYAHEKAIVEQVIYRLNLDSSEEKNWLTYRDSATFEFKRLSERLGKVYYLSEGLNLNSEKEFINFYPDGRADALSFYLTNQNGKKITLEVQPNLGNVRIKQE